MSRACTDRASSPDGGPMALYRAIAPIVEEAGRHTLHWADVARATVADGRATGVERRCGEVALADVVVSNAGVQNTFGRLLDDDVATGFGVRQRLGEVGDSYGLGGLDPGLRASADELGMTPAKHRASLRFDKGEPWKYAH